MGMTPDTLAFVIGGAIIIAAILHEGFSRKEK